MKKRNKTARGLTLGIAVIFLLCICLAATTFALVYSTVSVENNIFVTGSVRINLNGGKPVIRESEFIFEPGMTVKKDFFIKNESSCEVYYRLYFQNIYGDLAETLEIKICDGDKLLYEGTPAELSRLEVSAADDILGINEIRELQLYFHFPEEAGNGLQNTYLSFDFAADATQVKNNSDKSFD